ncbi:MAG: hypothetical protein OXH04_02415, partial [Acidobacteria bacterium]|nr:hypothetical protein [Acidobacteriota bacterium]
MLAALYAAARRSPLTRLVLVVGLVAAGVAGLRGAELQQETIEAWKRYVAATERRIAAEVEDGDRFLVQDFLPDAERLRAALLAGEPVIDRMDTRDAQGERLDVPKGRIHHWRGAILVPNATVDHVVDSLQHTMPAEE